MITMYLFTWRSSLIPVIDELLDMRDVSSDWHRTSTPNTSIDIATWFSRLLSFKALPLIPIVLW
jgi:hypothetical protein